MLHATKRDRADQRLHIGRIGERIGHNRRNPFQPARGMSPSYAAVIARLKVA
jgi:hypothetical protein